MEIIINEIVRELNLENNLIVSTSSEPNSHNKVYISNNSNWQATIHLSIFDNYLHNKYQNKALLLSIDSSRDMNTANSDKIKNFESEFINQDLMFEKLDSGFTLATFDNQELLENDKIKIKDAIQILISIYEDGIHE